MEFVQNFPFMTIILSLFSGPLSSVLDGKKAKRLNLAVISLIGMMSAAVLGYVLKSIKANEIRRKLCHCVCLF